MIVVHPNGDDHSEAIEVSLNFEVEEHNFFVRKKNDVHIEVPITYSQVSAPLMYHANPINSFIGGFGRSYPST